MITLRREKGAPLTHDEMDNNFAFLNEKESPQGQKGDKGDPGEAATITIGAVTTGTPGSAVTVTNTGTLTEAVLNFEIPQGDPGTGGGVGGGSKQVQYNVNGSLAGQAGFEYDQDKNLLSVKKIKLGDGDSFNANSIGGDDEHWVELTNNPSTGSGKQLLRLNSYGSQSYGNNVHFCRYMGTESAPAAITNNAFLMSFGYRGHDGGGLSQSAAAYQVVATENWSGSGHGCRFNWDTTPNGSIVRSQAMSLSGDTLEIYRRTGIGVIPPAWHANYRAIDLAMKGCAVRGHISTPELTLTANTYYDSGHKYAVSGAASIYQQTLGTHRFSAAPSGSAGGTATITDVMVLSPVTGTGYNAAGSAMKINKDSVTGRSINAAGTVNAGGADYAEYMIKSPNCSDITKGQIIGINHNGEITDQWVDAVTFMVKSTDPSYVGGDIWGRPDVVGEPPAMPGPEASSDDWNNYAMAYAEYENLVELERKKYDRIAFAGQVPVNVMAGQPGDYIVPVRDGDGITGMSVPEDDMTFAQYMRAVGRVVALEVDGRARIIVKVA